MSTVGLLRKLLPHLDRLQDARVAVAGRRVTLDLSGNLVVAGQEHDVERATLRGELLAPDQVVLHEVKIVPRGGLKRAGYQMLGGDRMAAAQLIAEGQRAGFVQDVEWAGGQQGALPARIRLRG